jgi:hypothetical protein
MRKRVSIIRLKMAGLFMGQLLGMRGRNRGGEIQWLMPILMINIQVSLNLKFIKTMDCIGN